MSRSFSQDLFSPFNTPEDSYEYLAEIFLTHADAQDNDRLVQESLVAGYEDFYHYICSKNETLSSPDATFPLNSGPWAKTDDLIHALAHSFSLDSGLLTPPATGNLLAGTAFTSNTGPYTSLPNGTGGGTGGYSAAGHTLTDEASQAPFDNHYHRGIGHGYNTNIPQQQQQLPQQSEVHHHQSFISMTNNPTTEAELLIDPALMLSWPGAPSYEKVQSQPTKPLTRTPAKPDGTPNLSGSSNGGAQIITTAGLPIKPQGSIPSPNPHLPPPDASPKRRISSHFFATPPASRPLRLPSRPPRGTVSSLPFPPLTAERFGLIQEEFAHDSFQLLIAVTFLVRTTGRAAIPVLRSLLKRFPTPADIANPENIPHMRDMIRHLGLCEVRLAAFQRYADGWLKQPPAPGILHRVRNYASRQREDVLYPSSPGRTDAEGETYAPERQSQRRSKGPELPSPAQTEDHETWEIGHLTQGRYAIDSWRIFCRDILLCKALDWRGRGREPEFQPEWMRVLPEDKELRACLRWMWMREGWEWDPITGERSVLREEMQNAVNEGRVAFDDQGQLVIVTDVDSSRHIRNAHEQMTKG